jgi:NADH dehydrogenase
MRVAIIGGTGFVGRYLTDALLHAGHSVSLLVRRGNENKLKRATHVQSTSGDIADAESIRELLDGCDALIYAVGILRESPRDGITFESTQYDGLVNAADAAREVGVRRLLLMSANGVKDPGTPYQETKLRAEKYAFESGLDLTVFRPSVIFGDPRGAMEIATQLFGQMVRPPLPATNFFSGFSPRKGAVLMSPVHVEDVAAAFVAALANDGSIGQTYTLGGPEVLTWQEMISRIAAATGRTKWFLPMPIAAMQIAATMLDWLPFFPTTRDQLTMLKEGNIADDGDLRSLIDSAPKPFTASNLAYLDR